MKRTLKERFGKVRLELRADGVQVLGVKMGLEGRGEYLASG